MKIISFNNNKGGVLKTTLATNFAGGLSRKNKKVLLVDLDPQGNVSSAFGINGNQLKTTLSEVLMNKASANLAILKDVSQNLDVLPCNKNLSFFEVEAYKGNFGKSPTTYLANKIKEIGKNYDYVVLDTAPYMNLLTLSSFKSADKIVIPTQTEIFSIKGVIDLINEIKNSETKTKIEIVPTLFVSNSNLHKEALKQLKEIAKRDKIKVTKTIITKSVAASNGYAYERLPIILTKSRSKTKNQLETFVEEILEN